MKRFFRYNKFRMLILLVLLLQTQGSIFCPVVSFGKGNDPWVHQNRKLTSNTFYRIQFTDNKTGWITGDSGTVLETKDGGKSWIVRSDLCNTDTLDTVFLTNISFCSIRQGRKVYKTEDGGVNWKNTYDDKNCVFRKILLINKNLYIIGESVPTKHSEKKDIVLKSSNQGGKWEAIYESSSVRLIGVNEIDGDTVFFGEKRTSKLFIKRNKEPFYSIDIPGIKSINNVVFSDSKSGWLICNDRIFITKDGGFSWSLFTSGNDRYWTVTKILFPSPSQGFMIGYDVNNGLLFSRSEDGGKNWQPIEGFGHIQVLTDINFSSSLEGWAVGMSGAVLHTQDGGKTWKDQNSGYPGSLHGIHFFSKKEGIATGGLYGGIYKQKPAILLTEDGGKNWKKQFETDKLYFTNLAVSGNQNLIVSGRYYGSLFVSLNKGKIWSKRQAKNFLQVSDIAVSNNNRLWALGMKKKSIDMFLEYSDDLGKSWKSARSFPPDCSKICFSPGGIGFVYERYMGRLYMSKDSGISWNLIKLTDKPMAISAISFLKAKEVWILGNSTDRDKEICYLFYTKDSGNTWKKLKPVFPVIPIAHKGFEANDLIFINNQIGWIVGSKGIILKTTDGGKTWKRQSSGTANNLNKIFFIDDKTGWIVGDFGTILFTNTGGE